MEAGNPIVWGLMVAMVGGALAAGGWYARDWWRKREGRAPKRRPYSVVPALPISLDLDAPHPPANELYLMDAGPTRIAVIAVIRTINPEMGLRDAKILTEQLPSRIAAYSHAKDVGLVARALEKRGALVEIREI